MKLTSQKFVLIFEFIVLSIIVFQGCVKFKSEQKIAVEFYPGTANVVVEEEPQISTTTPGTIKLPMKVNAFKYSKSRQSYQDPFYAPRITKEGEKCVFYTLRFTKNDYKSYPIIVYGIYKKGRAVGAALLATPMIFLSKRATANMFDWNPKTIYVIDKKEAETLGKIEPLILALKSKVVWVRVDAAEALGNIEDNEAVGPLIDALRDEDWYVRRKVAWALGKIEDSRAVEPLVTALKDVDWGVRKKAAEAMGKIRDTRAIDPLITALNDVDLDVQEKVAEALSKITNEEFGMNYNAWLKWWKNNKEQPDKR